MMLFISVVRYHAAIHPLKPALSRRKMKNVCCLVYIFGLIAGYLPAVLLSSLFGKDITRIYDKFYYSYVIFCYYIFPTLFMAVVYYKISRDLIKQNKYMKNLCSSLLQQRTANFNILKSLRNRRTSLVSLCAVLCYGVGNVPMLMWLSWEIFGRHNLLQCYLWVKYFANVFRVFGSHAVNPLIYGILDKKLVFFWKRRSFKRKHTPQGN